jgi:hypothetical protein
MKSVPNFISYLHDFFRFWFHLYLLFPREKSNSEFSYLKNQLPRGVPCQPPPLTRPGPCVGILPPRASHARQDGHVAPSTGVRTRECHCHRPTDSTPLLAFSLLVQVDAEPEAPTPLPLLLLRSHRSTEPPTKPGSRRYVPSESSGPEAPHRAVVSTSHRPSTGAISAAADDEAQSFCRAQHRSELAGCHGRHWSSTNHPPSIIGRLYSVAPVRTLPLPSSLSQPWCSTAPGARPRSRHCRGATVKKWPAKREPNYFCICTCPFNFFENS